MQTDNPVKGAGGKAPVPLVAVLAALAFLVAGAAIFLQVQERNKRLATERELLMTQAERDDVKSQLQVVREAKSQVDSALAQSQTELIQTRTDLDAAVSAREALAKAVEERQKEIDRLAKDLEQSRAEHEQVARDLQNVRAQQGGLQKELEDLKIAKTALESKVMELTGQPTVELEKVVVTKPGAMPIASASSSASQVVTPISLTQGGVLEGQVIVVNREYDFIVMNIGKNHGLAVGQEFQIVRGSQVLGKVKVEKIYNELSAAAILPESNKALIREGDAVKAL